MNDKWIDDAVREIQDKYSLTGEIDHDLENKAARKIRRDMKTVIKLHESKSRITNTKDALEEIERLKSFIAFSQGEG